MSRRRGWMGLAVLAVAVLAALAVWRAARRSGGEEAEAATDVPVRVGAVTRTTLNRYVAAFGSVEPAPPGEGGPAAGARVGAPVSGVVAAVACREGELVERGALLVRLDTRVADVRVAKGREAVKFAEIELARQRKMAAADATSPKALAAAEQQLAAARSELAAAQAERRLLLVRAPLAGTVVRLNARPGDAVDPTVVLAEIADLDRLVLAAGVPSAEAGLLRVGQAVELAGDAPTAYSAAAPATAGGTVAVIGTRVDPANDTVPVRIALPAGSARRPGALLEARIVVETRNDCLAVPVDALVADGSGAPAVAVVHGDRAVLTPVRAGVRDRGFVEVEGAGIREGTPVVVEGAYGLPAETKIRAVGP